MRTVDARTGDEWLERDQCLRLLAADDIGRLVVVAGGAPAIFPVNYALDEGTVVFRTGTGTKLESGPRARACFEIDGFDRERATGWSVVVTGRLEEETGQAALERLWRLPLTPWAAGAKLHWMRLVPDRVTGRRVGSPAR